MAGWTTANPTIYRAGLAFQAMAQTVFPNVSRFWATFTAGVVATIAGAFPAFAWQLLGFVGLYGTILAPMGGVIFFDWYFRRGGDAKVFQEAKPASTFNLGVLLAWLIPVVPSFYLIVYRGYTAVNFVLPCWLICGILYLLFSRKPKTVPSSTPLNP